MVREGERERSWWHGQRTEREKGGDGNIGRKSKGMKINKSQKAGCLAMILPAPTQCLWACVCVCETCMQHVFLFSRFLSLPCPSMSSRGQWECGAYGKSVSWRRGQRGLWGLQRECVWFNICCYSSVSDTLLTHHRGEETIYFNIKGTPFFIAHIDNKKHIRTERSKLVEEKEREERQKM